MNHDEEVFLLNLILKERKINRKLIETLEVISEYGNVPDQDRDGLFETIIAIADDALTKMKGK